MKKTNKTTMSLIKKNFYQKNHVIIYGKHSCLSAIKNKQREKLLLLTNENNYRFWTKEISQRGLPLKVLTLSQKELDEISNYNPHQNIILFAKPLKRISMKDYLTKANDKTIQKLVLLDQITDPQNIGSIIRSAFAFNFDAVGLLKNNSPSELSSIIKASSGEIEKITLIELKNLVNDIKLLQENGYFVYGLTNEGKKNINKIFNTDQKFALVVGSEGKGLRKLTTKTVDDTIHIPINNHCNSINASNAAAIAFYQLSK